MTGRAADGFPPGPDWGFDLDIREESFPVVGELLARYGDVVGVRGATREAPAVVVNDPELVGRVLATHYRNYVKGAGTERVRLLLGEGLIVSDGEPWRGQRRMMQPSFHRQVITRLAAVMWECNRRLLERWRGLAQRGEPIDLSAEVAALTLEIVLRSLFGSDYEAITTAGGGRPFAFLTEKPERDLTTVQLFRAPRRLIRELIDRRRIDGRERQDLLALLLAARHPVSGETMSDRQLSDEITTLIVAGHETTAGTLGWAWYLLSQHPAVESALHRELAPLDLDCEVDLQALQQAPYLSQLLKETMRLYPPGWLLSRRALAADRLGRWEIPAGTEVFVAPYYLHRHPRLWEQPERFAPERFADPEVPRHRFAYLPFGAGPRRCIGDSFASAEMAIHLGLLARHLRLRWAGSAAPALEPRINLRARDPLVFRIELRG